MATLPITPCDTHLTEFAGLASFRNCTINRNKAVKKKLQNREPWTFSVRFKPRNAQNRLGTWNPINNRETKNKVSKHANYNSGKFILCN